MKLLRLLLLLSGLVVIAIAALMFVTHNQSDVVINFLLFPEISIKAYLGFTGFFIAGGLVGLLVSFPLIVKHKVAYRQLERRMHNNSKIISQYNT